jgi:hypothetical protein
VIRLLLARLLPVAWRRQLATLLDKLTDGMAEPARASSAEASADDAPEGAA